MSRPTRGEIKHRETIKTWLDNPDAEVYIKTPFSSWTKATRVHWLADYEYKVIKPEYRGAWDAWLDDELEVESVEDNWVPIRLCDGPPMLILPPDKYRRKPKQQKSYTFTASDSVTEYFLDELGEGAVITANNSTVTENNPADGPSTVEIFCKVNSAG